VVVVDSMVRAIALLSQGAVGTCVAYSEAVRSSDYNVEAVCG